MDILWFVIWVWIVEFILVLPWLIKFFLACSIFYFKRWVHRQHLKMGHPDCHGEFECSTCRKQIARLREIDPNPTRAGRIEIPKAQVKGWT